MGGSFVTSLRRRVALRAVAVAASAAMGAAATLALASPASAHHPIVSGTAECDETTGEWVITWTVENSERDLEGTIKRVTTTPEMALSTITVGATLPKKGQGVLTEQVRVGNDVTSASLSVSARWDRKGHVFRATREATVTLGGECAPTAPVVESKSDCDTLTVIITNPAKEPLEAVITVGEKTEPVTVAPGDTEEVPFPAGEGTEATVTIGDKVVTLQWVEPEDCEEPEPSEPAQPGEGGGDEDEELPETGVPTGLLAGGAALLLAAGAGMYLVARRRRVTFTV